MFPFTESTIEEATLEWFQTLGYGYGPRLHIAPGPAFPG
jgi:hypothetical protein